MSATTGKAAGMAALRNRCAIVAMRIARAPMAWLMCQFVACSLASLLMPSIAHAQTAPVLLSAFSRAIHGAAGAFDLPLSLTPANPATEPRRGPGHTLVFTFDKAITGANAAVTEGVATVGTLVISGNDVVVAINGVTNRQFVTVALSSVTSADGGTGGSGSVRVGFLEGDVNQSRVVSVADLGLVNAQLAQLVTAANFIKDINVSGTLTLADKGLTNAQLTVALPAISTTTLASSINPSVPGQSVTFTATVTAIAPTGTVAFTDNGIAVPGCAAVALTGSGNVRTADCATSTLPPGAHAVTANYSGDVANAGSTSAPLTQIVAKSGSTTAVTSSASPTVFGQPVTFTATVSGTGGIPSGTVTFLDGAAGIGCAAQTVTSGVATCVTSSLSVGGSPHTINATYNGDANFLTSTNSVSQTVNKASTTLTATTSGSPSASGQSVTLTATLAVTAPGSGSPTGNVTFLDGASGIGCSAQTVTAGVATCVTSALSVGGSPHTINATYNGDASFLTSTNSVIQTVNKAATTVAVTTSGSPSTLGQSVTFTGTISVTAPGSGSPTGNVTFLDGAAGIGCSSQVVTTGVATCVTGALSVGGSPHTINATYNGDASFLASTNSVAQTVNKASPTVTLVLTVGQGAPGDPVTFVATIGAPGASGSPTGTVTFKRDGITIVGSRSDPQPIVLVAVGDNQTSHATFTTEPPDVPGDGVSHSYTAVYSGDASYSGSTSLPLFVALN